LDHLSTVLHPFHLFRASQSKDSLFIYKQFQQLFSVTNFDKNGGFLGLGSGMGFNARDFMGISHPAGTSSEQHFQV
jgi:hypothetical protein